MQRSAMFQSCLPVLPENLLHSPSQLVSLFKHFLILLIINLMRILIFVEKKVKYEHQVYISLKVVSLQDFSLSLRIVCFA